MYTNYKELSDITFGYSNSIEIIQEEFKYIKKYVESYDDLTDLEKYELLTHFLYLRYNYQDIINLINIKEHRNISSYTKLVDIPTKMEYLVEHLEDDWSTWTDKNREVLTCATHDTFELKKPIYSYKEILDLIKHEVIYPVRKYDMRIEDYTEEKENLEHIKTFISWIDGDITTDVDEHANWNNKIIIKPSKESISIMVKYLEETISKEQLFAYIKASFKDFLHHLDYWGFHTDEEKETYNELMEYYNTHFKGKRKIKKRG